MIKFFKESYTNLEMNETTILGRFLNVFFRIPAIAIGVLTCLTLVYGNLALWVEDIVSFSTDNDFLLQFTIVNLLVSGFLLLVIILVVDYLFFEFIVKLSAKLLGYIIKDDYKIWIEKDFIVNEKVDDVFYGTLIILGLPIVVVYCVINYIWMLFGKKKD